MKKKRLVFISLVLALVLTMLAPAPALAKGDHQNTPPEPTSFEGAGYVTGVLWDSFSSRPVKNGYILQYKGEMVPGVLVVSDWDALEGATLYTVHNSVVRVDESGNVISGKMSGTFTLTAADGESILKGRFSGNITTGQLDPATGGILQIQDQGRWISTKSTGEFEGMKAWGTWSLKLLFPYSPPMTDYNLLTWSGEYISHP